MTTARCRKRGPAKCDAGSFERLLGVGRNVEYGLSGARIDRKASVVGVDICLWAPLAALNSG